MDEGSMGLEKPIHTRSNHHVGDMYIHKKHKFMIQIIGRGSWSSKRACKVVHGEVPQIVLQRVQRIYGTSLSPYDTLTKMLSGDSRIDIVLDYSTCALTTCFTKLKAGQVLFG